MCQVLFFVVSKHLRSYDAFEFRIKMGKEVGVAEQHPVKKTISNSSTRYSIVKKARKELQEREIVSDSIGCGHDDRCGKKRNCHTRLDLLVCDWYMCISTP